MDQNDDCSNFPPLTYAYGLYGPLQNLSRVGDEYQTLIPTLITNYEYLNYIENPFEEEEKNQNKFLIGLDIPVVWINQENVDPTSLENDKILVPGCVLEHWSEIDKGSFVLGLYIFEKDFVRLKRFIGNKKLGDILSYYYGNFYKGSEYRRWSDCRKSRGKRCILGQRIFSGLRQQEFLARLVPNVSQECQLSLLEVSRSLEDGKISFEQYITSLKTLIGIKLFIEAVGIGKGKQDLTGNTVEPTKQNQAIHIRPEIPIGKACSSLTSTEIIQFLTGDYRLSKARSNDLFWEAVWPRLLARGWHSEQPNGYNYAANGRHSLVFLMPGVKKFSRKLVKGESYLDSVTDVLNKVASDPQLLEIDNDEKVEILKLETNLENEEDENENEHENGSLENWKNKNHCYLQPRGPNLGNVMKFTVVDTSLKGGKIFRVRELETMNLNSRNRCSRSDEICSELVSSDESGSGNTFLVEQEKPVKKQKTDSERKKHLKGSDPEGGPTRKILKARKSKQEDSTHHAKRRRRLTACSRVDPNLKSGSTHERDVGSSSHVGSSSQANNNNNHNDNHKLSSNLSFTSRCSSIDTVEEQEQPMNLIDLNYPQITPEFGNSEFVTEVKVERNGPGPQKEAGNIVGPKEQENGSRRQGTRNRPPTARALEAFANGFLTVNTRRKGKEDSPRDSVPRLRNYRNTPRGEIGVVSECSTGDASSAVKGDDENGEIGK